MNNRLILLTVKPHSCTVNARVSASAGCAGACRKEEGLLIDIVTVRVMRAHIFLHAMAPPRRSHFIFSEANYCSHRYFLDNMGASVQGTSKTRFWTTKIHSTWPLLRSCLSPLRFFYSWLQLLRVSFVSLRPPPLGRPEFQSRFESYMDPLYVLAQGLLDKRTCNELWKTRVIQSFAYKRTAPRIKEFCFRSNRDLQEAGHVRKGKTVHYLAKGSIVKYDTREKVER